MDDNAANENMQSNTNVNCASNVKEENSETAFNQDITEKENQHGQGEVAEKKVQLDQKEVNNASNELTDMEKLMGDIVQLVQTMKIGMTVKIEKSDEKKLHIEYTEALNDKIKIENDERVGSIFQQDQDTNLRSAIDTEHFNETKDAECNIELPCLNIENTGKTETFQQNQGMKIISTGNDENFYESHPLPGTESNLELSSKDAREGDIFRQDQLVNIYSTDNTESSAEIKAAESSMEHCDNFENTIEENNSQQDPCMKIPSPVNANNFDERKGTELNGENCDNIDNKIEEDGSYHNKDMNSYSKVDIVYFDETIGSESNMELSYDNIENTKEEDIFQQDPDMKIFSTVNVETFDDPKATEGSNTELPCDKIYNTIQEEILQHDQDQSTFNTETLKETNVAESNRKPSDNIDNTIQEEILQHDQDMNIQSSFDTGETLDETNCAESNREQSHKIKDIGYEDILEQEQDVTMNATVKKGQLDETKTIESNIEALNSKSTSELDTDKGNISGEDQGIENSDTVNMEKLEENTVAEPSIDTVDYNTTAKPETIEETILRHDQEKDNQVSVKNGNQDVDVFDNVTFKPIQRDDNILSESSIAEENDKSLVIKQDTSEGIILPQKKRRALIRYLKKSPTRNAMGSLKPSDWKREDCMPGDFEIRMNETEKNMAIEENNFTEGQGEKATEKFKMFNKIKGWFKNRSEDEESEDGDIDEKLNPTHYFAEDGSVKTVDLSKKSRKKN